MTDYQPTYRASSDSQQRATYSASSDSQQRATYRDESTLSQAKQQQIQAQAERGEKILNRGKRCCETGSYQGYDVGSGLHQVKMPDGSLVSGKFESTGAAAKGAMISVYRSQGAIARFDLMPR